jgi:hypothetical protein
MNNSWMFVGALLVVAAVPFVLIGAIRFVAWASPAHARWVARHYRAYWLAIGGMHLAVGVANFVLEGGEPFMGAAFSGLGLVYVVQGLLRVPTADSLGRVGPTPPAPDRR